MTWRPALATRARGQAGRLRPAAVLRRRLTGAAAVVAAAATLGALAAAIPATADTSGAISAVGAGKCLDVPNSSTTPGTQVDISSCTGGAGQIWTYTSSHQLAVYSGSSQMCLDAYAGQTAPGTKVEIWTCNGGANQQWNVNSGGTITGVQSSLCLDVTGASTASGAPLELWTCNGQSNQQWALGSCQQGGEGPVGSELQRPVVRRRLDGELFRRLRHGVPELLQLVTGQLRSPGLRGPDRDRRRVPDRADAVLLHPAETVVPHLPDREQRGILHQPQYQQPLRMERDQVPVLQRAAHRPAEQRGGLAGLLPDLRQRQLLPVLHGRQRAPVPVADIPLELPQRHG